MCNNMTSELFQYSVLAIKMNDNLETELIFKMFNLDVICSKFPPWARGQFLSDVSVNKVYILS